MMVYLNDSLVPLGEAKVPVTDRGFLYGDGVFETMRARRGRVFRLRAHLGRLRRGLEVLGIELERTGEALADAIREVLEANRLSEAAVRLTITRGTGGTRLDTEGCDAPTLFIQATRFAPHAEQIYQQGFSAVTLPGLVNDRSPLSGIKSLNRLEHILARREAARAGVDEALLGDREGLVVEAAASNVFATRSDIVITPPVEAGALPGITRACVLDLLRERGVVVREEPLPLGGGGAGAFAEAWLTNSLMGVMPLTKVDGTPVGVPGVVTSGLRGAYERLLRVETN
ncbi:MAG: aminotransferase class IV [Armatimonadota bacterium]